jgi:hypothetical protein
VSSFSDFLLFELYQLLHAPSFILDKYGKSIPAAATPELSNAAKSPLTR